MAALRLESPQLSFVDGSLGIGRFAQAPIRVYPGFLVAAGLLAMPNWWWWPGLPGMALFVIDLVTVFASVLLHELAHAVVAERYGVAARRIDLYLFGGVVALDALPKAMRQDCAIVIAGPLANLVLAGMAYALLILVGGGPSQPVVHGGLWADAIFAPHVAGRALTFALYLNLGLFAVNMLPAFPLDGGRLLFMLIARRWDRRTATIVVARFGVYLGLASYLLFLVTAMIGCPIWSPPDAGGNLKALRAAVGDGTSYY
jgi:Zn-dependent protease